MATVHSYRKQYNLGFGLLETVIASGILTLVVGASLTLTNAVVRNSTINAQRIIMDALAQEGVERAINIYKTNLIDEKSATTWGYGLGSPTNNETGFGQCTTVECNGLYRWGYSSFSTVCFAGQPCFYSNTETVVVDEISYLRIMSFSQPSAPTPVDELVVRVEVSKSDNANLLVTKEEILYDPGL